MEEEWVWCFDAIREVQRCLRDRLGEVDPAPWIDRSPEWHETPEDIRAQKWIARMSLALRRAFLAEKIQAHLVQDAKSRPVPGWAWENAEASANAFNFGWLPIDPFLGSDLRDCQRWRCCVRRTELNELLESIGLADIGSLPELPKAVDHSGMPSPITYSEPSDKPYVELTEALTWAAFGLAMSHEVFGFAELFRFGPFRDPSWLENLERACASFSEKGGGDLLRVRGRYVEKYSDHEAAKSRDTVPLTAGQLRDFARYDSLNGGLEFGSGCTWARPLGEILNGRFDGFRDVEVNRADLLRCFPARVSHARALRANLPASLPGIGPVLGVEDAVCWTAFNKASNDTTLLVDDAGNLAIDNGDGTCAYVVDISDLPQDILTYRAAQMAVWRSLRDGTLASYIAPPDIQPLRIARHYWNSLGPNVLHLMFEGFEPGEPGIGCPILLSRTAVDAWRAASAVTKKVGGTVPANRKLNHDEIIRQAATMRDAQSAISKGSAAASIVAELPPNPKSGKPRDTRHIERIIAHLWEGGLPQSPP